VEIDNVMKWEATAVTADKFRQGRTFLIGDAAHEMPPYGGYGGNTGIHDAHNLAWKLAAVLDGQAGDELLSTYEDERKPVAAFTVEQGYSRYVMRAAPFRAADGIETPVPDANIDLGYRYRSSAVIADADDDGAIQGDPRELRGLPGSRAPHYELVRDGQKVSTLDFFQRNFVLLTGTGAGAWRESGEAAASEVGIGLDVYTVDAAMDPDGNFAESYGITPTGAVLVRPDGFVAWRATTDGEAELHSVSAVLGSLLGQPVADQLQA
jgi:hypothetical protein